jgi:hypothetical protein
MARRGTNKVRRATILLKYSDMIDGLYATNAAVSAGPRS